MLSALLVCSGFGLLRGEKEEQGKKRSMARGTKEHSLRKLRTCFASTFRCGLLV